MVLASGVIDQQQSGSRCTNCTRTLPPVHQLQDSCTPAPPEVEASQCAQPTDSNLRSVEARLVNIYSVRWTKDLEVLWILTRWTNCSRAQLENCLTCIACDQSLMLGGRHAMFLVYSYPLHCLRLESNLGSKAGRCLRLVHLYTLSTIHLYTYKCIA